jgi:hypothetical protein
MIMKRNPLLLTSMSRNLKGRDQNEGERERSRCCRRPGNLGNVPDRAVIVYVKSVQVIGYGLNPQMLPAFAGIFFLYGAGWMFSSAIKCT